MRSAGQVGGTERNANEERRASSERARDLDVAAMQLHELVNQGESDAGALLRATSRAFDPMEPLEQPGYLVLRNADARVRYLEHSFGGLAPQAHRDRAGEGELESVREQVEYDLLPHLSIEKQRLIHRLAIHHEGETRGLHRRAEIAREIARESRGVDRLEGGLQPPGLDAREVEQ